jgi:predicted AlkP superfamily phosphohydrolase/phosphomutase
MFKSLFGKSKAPEAPAAPAAKRLFVLGLDGVPHSFITARIAEGKLPNLAALFRQGSLRRMDSVLPCISSVAWASFQTGVNPARHAIFGFVDREPNPFKVFIPTGRNVASTTLWEHLGRVGKKVVVINVPMTYPPRPVNGKLVSCFLCTDLAKGTWPPELAVRLKAMGYKIDADAWLARKDKQAFMADLDLALEKRFEATFELMAEPWDFFQLHVMETDRINHFLWRSWEQGEAPWKAAFDDYYRKIDGFVGELLGRLPEGCELVVLSDHGFCSVDKEVYLNHWLEEQGYLLLAPAAGKEKPESVADMTPETRAYSLIPGRVYLNLAGREQKGSVAPGAAEELKRELSARLVAEVKDPETGRPIIARVVRREEVYSGPGFERAADLIAVPHDGFDLKGNVARPELAVRGALEGMHTFADAFFFVKGREITKPDNGFSVMSGFATCCKLLGVEVPAGIEGEAVV